MWRCYRSWNRILITKQMIFYVLFAELPHPYYHTLSEVFGISNSICSAVYDKLQEGINSWKHAAQSTCASSSALFHMRSHSAVITARASGWGHQPFWDRNEWDRNESSFSSQALLYWLNILVDFGTKRLKEYLQLISTIFEKTRSEMSYYLFLTGVHFETQGLTIVLWAGRSCIIAERSLSICHPSLGIWAGLTCTYMHKIRCPDSTPPIGCCQPSSADIC